MKSSDWMARFQAELQKAEDARLAGNEGMARVCARRAAGLAAGEYLSRQGMLPHDPSAYARLKYLRSLPDIPQEVRAVTDHFLLRITPDHSLPVEADLIAEARWLVKELLGV